MKSRGRATKGRESDDDFPGRDRYTVSRLCVGDICWICECRILEIGGDEDMTFAWCDCELPENHHEMQVL